MANNRGSEWRKWDLHIHTPKSIVNNYGNGTSNDVWEQYIDALDNEFIMSELVTILRRIKKYRQIILVSHNANIVVNSDSEQVIIASNDNGVLHYKSGALENTEINQEICRILEGGKEAFEKREKKYGFR